MGDGYEGRKGYDPAEAERIALEQDRIFKDASGSEDRQALVGRTQFSHEHPEKPLPAPEEVLGEICPICGGTTWVVCANAKLKGPIMAQLEPCNNPRGCPQIKALGQRKIIHLAVPHNHFNRVVTLPDGSRITALISGED